jgi:signal transduction histidine kinase/CheY-like chemotaxis protein
VSEQEQFSGGAVLIVDDVPANLLALEAVLHPLGVRTVRAQSGAEAIARATERQFALILLDVQMPEMDGFEVARRLRKTTGGRETPIIFLTAIHREARYARTGYEVGGADYLLKPFDPDVLQARVRSFVDLYNQREKLRREQVSARTRERDEAMRQLVAFERIATAALKSTDLDVFLRTLLDVVVDAVDSVDCAIILLREGDMLRSRASIGIGAEETECFDERIGEGFAGTVAAAHEAIYLTAASTSPLMEKPWIRTRGIRGLLGVPLVDDGEVCGVAIVGSVGTSDFADSERRLLTAVAARAAAAVDRVRSQKHIEQSEARQRFLAEVGAALSASLEIEATLTTVAQMIVPRLGDGCAIDVVGVDDAKSRVAAAGVDVSADAVSDERTLVLPLRWRETNVGALTLVSTDAPRAYDDVVLARELAIRLAMAIENADLYRKAQDAIRIRDEFLSIASHELRTPLTPLKLHLGVMRKRLPLDAGALRDKLAFVDRQVDRMNGLIEQLLDVSKITGGRLELEPEWLDLHEIAERIVERFATNEHGSALRLQGEELRAYLDPLRVEQLITNLVTNAIKYGGGKPIDIEIGAEENEVRIVVRDRGIGIAPSKQASIFGRFERAVSAREYGGFGLGLWIAQRVVEASGGRIAVKSALGEGAEFVVVLPLRNRSDSKGMLQAATRVS